MTAWKRTAKGPPRIRIKDSVAWRPCWKPTEKKRSSSTASRPACAPRKCTSQKRITTGRKTRWTKIIWISFPGLCSQTSASSKYVETYVCQHLRRHCHLGCRYLLVGALHQWRRGRRMLRKVVVVFRFFSGKTRNRILFFLILSRWNTPKHQYF